VSFEEIESHDNVFVVPKEQFCGSNNRDEDIVEEFEQDNTTIVIEEYVFHKENLFTAPVYDRPVVDEKKAKFSHMSFA